ncbi:hypothetical protein Tco_0870726 [Tanacetum coccineum]
MTKSYCSLKKPEVSFVVPSTNKPFEAPHHPSFFQLLVNRLDHDISSFLFQCTPSSLWQLLHSDILCDGVNINDSLRVLIWSVWAPFPDAGFGSFGFGDVDFLMVTFDSQLKIFDSLLNNQASGEHSQCYCEVGNIIAREICKPILNNKEKHVLDSIDMKTWKVPSLNL